MEGGWLNSNSRRITLIFIATFRIICLIIWSFAILFATYQVYLAAEEFIPWQSDPVLNEGCLSAVLGRGRDDTDYEWAMFTDLLFTKLIYWYLLYAIFSWFLYRQVKIKIAGSILFSFSLLTNLVGWRGGTFLILQPVLYWYIFKNTKSKLILWATTIFLLCLLNIQGYKDLFVNHDQAEYFFAVTSAWTYARCISFCLDCSERPSIQISFWNFMDYCFYFPLVITGPIILYCTYEQEVILKRRNRGKPVDFLKGMTRMVALIAFNEVILHCIYFRPLALTQSALPHMGLWVLGGIVFWLGQFFMLKYRVMYGIPTQIAELDGVKMPPLPKCPSYIHRYSVLWKDFDRGLYYFLLRYTYIPTMDFFETKTKGLLHVELRKLIASFASFTYVYVWHGIMPDILVWSALNFLGITIERVGSYIKRRIDSIWNLDPTIWDFVFEPVITVPLAAMSILNSSVFCGTLEFAAIATKKLFLPWPSFYALCILYCFTHVAVTVRTWTNFQKQLKQISYRSKVTTD